MSDRTSVGNLRATLSAIGVGSIAGWQMASMPDNDIPTGEYIDAQGRRIMTSGVATEGGELTLEKVLSLKQRRIYKRMFGKECTVIIHKVDSSNRPIATVERKTGTPKGDKISDMDRASGDPIMVTAKIATDGDVIG